MFFFATFSLFTNGPDVFINAHKEKLFNKIYSTNLTYIPSNIIEKDWFIAADCSHFLAEIIDNNNKNKPITDLIKKKKSMPSKISKKAFK